MKAQDFILAQMRHQLEHQQRVIEQLTRDVEALKKQPRMQIKDGVMLQFEQAQKENNW
jgi:hypothetical protein